jgi:predicted transcriptional regulator
MADGHGASRPPHSSPRLHNTIRLSADGLAKVLGDLEARVMETVWAMARPVPARGVYESIAKTHKVAQLTVTTVLNKLVAKGLLTRHKHHDLLHYSACLTQDEFIAHTSRRVVEGILSFGPDAVAASFVDVLAERDPERLAQLGRLIGQRLQTGDNQ